MSIEISLYAQDSNPAMSHNSRCSGLKSTLLPLAYGSGLCPFLKRSGRQILRRENGVEQAGVFLNLAVMNYALFLIASKNIFHTDSCLISNFAGKPLNDHMVTNP